MHTLTELPTDKDAAYAELAASLRALLDGEHDLVANAANMAAFRAGSISSARVSDSFMVCKSSDFEPG